MADRRVSVGVYAGVFIVSAVTLALEILLTRVLSLVMWHHFTYVVIGVALLGFGAAGSRVMVREALRRRPPGEPEPPSLPGRRLAGHALLLAVSIPLCYVALTHVRFEPLALWSAPSNLAALGMVYALIAVPFYFAGLAIVDAIQSFPERVGSVYFADLAGAGAGAVLALQAIEPLGGPAALAACAAAAAGAALLFALAPEARPRSALTGSLALGAAAAGAWILFAVFPAARSGRLDPPLAPSKELALLPAGLRVEESAWNSLARIDVTIPQRVPPAMGGAFPPDRPAIPLRAIFQDGSAPTPLVGRAAVPGPGGEPDPELEFLRRASAAAGHVALRARGAEDVEAMAIGVGGGIDLLIALQSGARSVTGVEINGATLRMLRERYADFTGRLAEDPRVELVHAEGRHYARASGRRFDLVQLSGVDTYTALASGAHTLAESYLYTREAVGELLDALTDRGVVCYTRIVFPDRPRETLRLAATAAEALERRGIGEPVRHLFLLSGGAWASLVVSRPPLEPEVLAALRSLAEENGYRVLFDPERPLANPFDDCLRRSPEEREAFYAAYPFDVRPATDDSPFFFDYFKWKGLLRPSEYGGHAYSVTYPVAHALLVLSLLQTVVLGALVIVLPLRRLGRLRAGRATGAAFAYFAALGAGFIAFEIALLQRYVLFLGHPTLSLGVVLPTLLVAAGAGSLTVRPATDARARLRLLAAAAPLVVLGSWALSSYALAPLLGLGLPLRIAVAVLFLAPAGFVLGQAFPAGIRVVSAGRPELVPWAWAVNAFTTVLGSTGAVLLAMEVGFTPVLLAVAPVYLAGILALRRAFPSGAAALPPRAAA